MSMLRIVIAPTPAINSAYLMESIVATPESGRDRRISRSTRPLCVRLGPRWETGDLRKALLVAPGKPFVK